jgi:replicative DNA helicase
MEFDEKVFIWALTSRPADVRRFASIFRPEWLENAAFRPILAEIYSFTKENETPPSIGALRTILSDKYPEAYELRFSPALDEILDTEPDTPQVIYTLNKARDAAIIRSLHELVTSNEMQTASSEGEGKHILVMINRWLNTFAGVSDEQSADLKEAIEHLIQTVGWDTTVQKIPSGVKPLDAWTSGGLRTKQLGIIMAPLGHGKSTVLMNMAYKMAAVQEANVWFITNELTIEEQTERFLSRLTTKPLKHIQNDPAIAYHGLGRHWQHRLHERLRLTAINKTVKTEDLESMMIRWMNISGWKPTVIILDFMERMAPNEEGHSRAQEWIWLGAIAQDLVRFAKRHNILIWTAAQTNRAGLAAGQLDLTHIQGSIRHLQEAAVVIGMKREGMGTLDKGGDEKIALEFLPLKLRHSKMTKTRMFLDTKLDRMFISNEELEPPEECGNGDDGEEQPMRRKREHNPGKKK